MLAEEWDLKGLEIEGWESEVEERKDCEFVRRDEEGSDVEVFLDYF
jgi:hypothetical protein